MATNSFSRIPAPATGQWHPARRLIVFAFAAAVLSCVYCSSGVAEQVVQTDRVQVKNPPPGTIQNPVEESATSERSVEQKQTGYIRTNDDVRIYYEQAGSGKPIVLIPGAGCSIAWWQRNFSELSQRFRVVAVDMRGSGRSQKCDWGHNCARYAMDVYELIHALGLHDVTLVGWSCGARTSYSYMMLFGKHRIRRVVIVDDTVHHTIHAPAPKDAGRKPGESDEEFSRRSIRHMVSPANPDALSEEDVDWMVAACIKPPASLGADGQAQDWRPFCSIIDLPVLIASGSHSGALPGCRYAAEHIPGARLEIFEHSGHGLFYTEADKFNQLVTDFVNDSFRRPEKND